MSCARRKAPSTGGNLCPLEVVEPAFLAAQNLETRMNLSAYDLAIDTFVPMLSTLQSLLGKGAEFAAAKKFDLAVLVQARLAPDMLPLQRQVQISCYHAKDAAARLTGKDPLTPANADETFDELRARVAATIAELQSLSRASFEAAFDRDIAIPMSAHGIVFEMKGYQYLRDWVFPHFYFHVVTAYDILRHNGVPLGKADYAGIAGRHIKPAPAPRT
jgi:hypothetical protein